MTDDCQVTINGVTIKPHGVCWNSERGWHDHSCLKHGPSTMARNTDGSAMCGRCYMERAESHR